MISAIWKYMITLIIVSAFFTGFNTDNALLGLASAASVVFGFMLQIAHARRKHTLTKAFIFWNAVITIAFCWFAFIFWKAKYNIYDQWFLVYLFVCAFMAVVFSGILYKVSRFSFEEILQQLARKYINASDKQEEDKI